MNQDEGKDTGSISVLLSFSSNLSLGTKETLVIIYVVFLSSWFEAYILEQQFGCWEF
jgi:hypothetical protein